MPPFPSEFDPAQLRNANSFEPPQGPREVPDAKPIQIRVIHERTPAAPKNRVASGRNTTDIPAPQSDIQVEKSPRLERAHSEPPKLFNQRLRAGGASSPAPHAYSTIPEYAEPAAAGAAAAVAAARSPRGDADPVAHKLSSSASAPSVPNTNNSGRVGPSPGAPVAPPRRSSSSASQASKQEAPEEKQAPQPPPPPPAPEAEAPRVRHIPIFVEGRDEPVFQKKPAQGDPAPAPPFRQPSEFYPPNVSKMRSQSASSPTPSSPGRPLGQPFSRNLNLKPSQPAEPTSPLSPPPSHHPIPMGCGDHLVRTDGSPSPPGEPSGPALPPVGPIPMPFTPTATPFASDATDGRHEDVHSVPIQVADKVEKEPEPDPPTAKGVKKASPAEEKLRKIESEVSELLERVEKFSGGKKDKEYLFLDDLLTQKMCILDGIESDGREDIRKMRKDSIKTINRCLSLLDKRASSTPLSERESNGSEGAKVTFAP